MRTALSHGCLCPLTNSHVRLRVDGATGEPWKLIETKCRLVWSSCVPAWTVAFPPALLVYHYTGPTTPSNFLRLHAAHQDRHSVAISKSAPSPCAKCCQLSNLQRCFGRCCFLPPSLWRCGLHPRGRGRRETTPSAAVARIISTACTHNYSLILSYTLL